MPPRTGVERSQFGENLRRIRDELGMSQGQMAELVGLDVTSRNNVAQYETGRTDPQLAIAIRFATALDVSLDELVAGTVEPESIECDRCKGVGRILL